MTHERDDALLAVLDALLDVQAAADRVLLRLRARARERSLESSGVYAVARNVHPIARTGQPGDAR